MSQLTAATTASNARIPPWRWRPPAVFLSNVGFVLLAIAGVTGGSLLASDSGPLLSVVVLALSTAGCMHTRLAIGQGAAAVQVALGAALLALTGAPPRLVAAVLISGVAAVALIARCTRRSEVLRVGVWSAVAAGATSASGLAATVPLSSDVILREALAAAAGGFLSAPVMLTVGPLAEWLFGHTTRLTMSEWLNYEHPLLRELASTAPGTFQHSINVGVLADAAARAIGADPLLARVGGLYHDVGKSRAPEFFVENQHGVNPHDGLSPLESARILRAHVHDGVELVLRHRMGSRIAAFVREHHGTATMRSLIDKTAPADSASDGEAYRSPGPKPKSRETAIVMIADQVEATARSRPPADGAACETIVRLTIDRTRADGQLDESGIPVTDLSRLVPAFTRALGGMYHQRMTYPEAVIDEPSPGFRLLRGRRGARS